MYSYFLKHKVDIKRYLRRMKMVNQDLGSSLHLKYFPEHWYQKHKINCIERTSFKTAKKAFISIETTDVCNLNCIMCDTAAATRIKGFMDMKDFISNLDLLEKAGQRIVTFHTIGDPLVDKNLDLKLQLCYERDIQVILRTNGLLLHRFFDVLIKYPPAYLLFSIDGATKETYEKIRINGNFDMLVNNMKELASLYRKNHV